MHDEKMMNLRKGGALSPDNAVVTKDGGGGEAGSRVTFDVAHQMIINVCLPRHSFFFFFLFKFSTHTDNFLLQILHKHTGEEGNREIGRDRENI